MKTAISSKQQFALLSACILSTFWISLTRFFIDITNLTVHGSFSETFLRGNPGNPIVKQKLVNLVSASFVVLMRLFDLVESSFIHVGDFKSSYLQNTNS